jgi:murein DD-endopeptidase MepM/ murein hydrolase activator NlpD
VILIERSFVIAAVAMSLLPVSTPASAVGGPHTPHARSVHGARGIEDVIPGSYAWPVEGPVIRGFVLPQGPYGSGHRGIDIAIAFGTPVHAANDGVVAFAGSVGGSLYVSIDHPDGVRTTYSWLSALGVRKGQSVARGDIVGATGHGHPELPVPHLHFGARMGSTYIDPMMLLDGGSVVDLIRLAPLAGVPR